MWHLKTKMGVFWVTPVSEKETEYLLGVDDQMLGRYRDAEQAAKDVHDQATGYFRWDAEPRIKAPLHIDEWVEGEPQNWKK